MFSRARYHFRARQSISGIAKVVTGTCCLSNKRASSFETVAPSSIVMKTTGSFVWIFEILTMSLGFSGGGARVVVVSVPRVVVGVAVSDGLELSALASEFTLNWISKQLMITQMGALRIFLICEEY